MIHLTPSRRQITGAYLGVIAIWSTTPLAIVWSGQGVHYTFPLFARMAIGLFVCLGWLAVTQTRFPLDERARRSYAIAGVSIWASMLCTYWGARFIPSGLISVVFGLSPIVTGLFAWAWLHEESASPLKIAGMLLGLAGLALVFGGSLGLGTAAHWGIAVTLAAVVLQAWGLVAVKRIGADIPAVAQTAGALSSPCRFAASASPSWATGRTACRRAPRWRRCIWACSVRWRDFRCTTT